MHVLKEYTNILTINKSKFICYINKCLNEDEYKTYLTSIKKKHYDADHVCSAFIANNQKRSSDDGEPSGTAGKPILNILEKNNMNNTCVLVVRYFGGIKLGANGLVRAYGDSVKECLSKADIYEEKKYQLYKLDISFSLANKIDTFINKNTIIMSKTYGENVEYEIAVETIETINKIKEYTSGIEPKFIKDIKIDKIVE